MSMSTTLRTLATLADHLPADVVSVHAAGVTVIVTNQISAARWREAFDARPEIDADVRLLEPIGRAS